MRKAVSIIVCAPYKDQFKILMLKRSDFGFYGGLFVFPGGTLSPADEAPEWNCIAARTNDLSLRICGIRETFEESGLLFTTPVTGLSVSEREEWRLRILQDPLHFIQFSRTTLRRPDVDSLLVWSRWLSPLHHPKRFDTTFYLRFVPEETMEEARADGKETIGVYWLTPQEILNKFKRKEITLLPPQYCQVTELASYTLEKAKQVAQSRVPETIEPVLINQTPTVFEMQLPPTGIFSGRIDLFHSDGKIFDIEWAPINSKL
jgi:8-oxo-dGTP pyrophosphatase MutT (NUDIX family)